MVVRRAATGIGLGLAALVISPAVVLASERRFAYTYESTTLPAGGVEIEPQTTWRAGRDTFYNRFDERLELEVGVTDRLMTAFYLNFAGWRAATGDMGQLEDGSELSGVSWEWKWKLLDPVADVIGLALYGELTGGPGEAELEIKVILDRRAGSFLFAANLVGELELELEREAMGGEVEAEPEGIVELDVGAAYFVTPALSLGVEARSHNVFAGGAGLESSTVFAGPVVSFAQEHWFATLTVLPQLAALRGRTEPSALELHDHERINARLVFGVHL